ncbi:aminopeptidase N [Nocardioides sp. zg-DK7169]|uniref:aminopeptidase N n=1 Tax=Nocardioides sp. zg-DK7169 TaxID=2736600 RepID=UPI001556B968|nr:aminopeptidase N [Nocardioides sp. zg-DK7169]NPC98178.1 aminopeptidase N [Nocardioides sp. zg-DK7169]
MSLTLDEARARAAQLSDVAYDIELDLTEASAETFGCRTVVTFTTREPETFLELTAARDLLVLVDGAPATEAYDGRRIALTDLPTGVPVRVEVSARVPYVTDGDGMHRFTDPADGETYLSAYLGMDVSQRVFPCFDQVDLKAPVTMTVRADPAWTVLANGRATGRDGGTWRFATTPPIPTNMVVVCAGPWHSVTWEHRGLPFGWHARRSLAAELDRDAAELRALTEGCFDHYAELLAEPFAFDSYDQAFVPGQNWGALETPGCVTYRDELLPRGRMGEPVRVRRATIVAHEMAHMWFGNLVTMRWWEDTWLNESFADYMGYRVARDGAGYADTLVAHEARRKPRAYDADLRRSTHPVAPRAEEVPDVDAAFNNFDQISYAKGNSVLRQLVTWLGDEAFVAGVDAHLAAHRFGNATLTDFVDALDAASDRDVRGWVEVWLRRSGHDTVRVERDGGVPVLSREGERPHRLRVTAYDVAPGGTWTEVGSRFVDVAAEPVRLEEWAGRVVVPNSHGETFARLRLDPESWEAARTGLSGLDDVLVRTVLWQHAFELVQSRLLPVEEYADLVAAHLPGETHPELLEAVLDRTLDEVLLRRTAPGEPERLSAIVADACARGLAAGADDPERALACTRGLIATSTDLDLLRAWLAAARASGRTAEGVELTPALVWGLVHRLAELGALDAAAIEEERRRDGTVDGDLGAARALAARPTEEAKAEAWSRMADDAEVSNRHYAALAAGLWSPVQGDLLEPYVARYLAEAPGIAERRGQSFSQVVGRAFPALALAPDQVQLLRDALTGELPPVLRRHWEDRLDDL